MKGTKVQTLGALCACEPLINGLGHATRSATYLSQATCVTVSGFRAALDLDTYPHRKLIRLWCAERAKPGRGKPALIMHIAFSACFNTISLEHNRFSKIAMLFSMPLYTALKLLVSPISRLVACSARIVVDNKQTNIQTHRPSTVTLAVHACQGLIVGTA